jgi:hypothetical protein
MRNRAAGAGFTPTMPRMTPPAFDPARYPRTYTASTGWLAAWWLMGGGMGVGGMAMLAAEWIRPPHAERTGMLASAGGWLALALLGVAALASVLRARVILGADYIEARGLRSWRLRREDIVDYRVHVHGGMREVRLRSRTRRRPYKFTHFFQADDAFAAWFAGLVDSDRRQHDAILRRIAADDTLGALPATRLDRVDQARRASRWLTWVTLALMLWALIGAPPHGVATWLVAALPPLALVLAWRSGNVFSLATNRSSPRSDLSALLFAPSLLLAMFGWFRADLAEPRLLVLPSLALGAVLAALALATCAELRAARVDAIVTAIVLVLYACGLLTLVNAALDRSPPTRGLAAITAMRHTSGKGGSAQLTLLGLPGHAAEPVERRVSDALYRRAAVGRSVCFADHVGLFGWHWAEIDDPSACAVD